MNVSSNEAFSRLFELYLKEEDTTKKSDNGDEASGDKNGRLYDKVR